MISVDRCMYFWIGIRLIKFLQFLNNNWPVSIFLQQRVEDWHSSEETEVLLLPEVWEVNWESLWLIFLDNIEFFDCKLVLKLGVVLYCTVV